MWTVIRLSVWPKSGSRTRVQSLARTDAVLTLDRRDFRAMRPLTAHKSFRLLPDDQ